MVQVKKAGFFFTVLPVNTEIFHACPVETEPRTVFTDGKNLGVNLKIRFKRRKREQGQKQRHFFLDMRPERITRRMNPDRFFIVFRPVRIQEHQARTAVFLLPAGPEDLS